MVTAEQVWDALDEIPDPEIPVISLVDLGVIRSVDVSDGHVRVEFTPTFLGCPALEAMKRALEETVTALGARAGRARDPGRLVVDRQDHARGAREASRRRLRAAAAARGAARRSSCSCRRTCTGARTAARATRRSRTSSARRRAARSVTARAASSRSSSSRRSSRQNAWRNEAAASEGVGGRAVRRADVPASHDRSLEPCAHGRGLRAPRATEDAAIGVRLRRRSRRAGVEPRSRGRGVSARGASSARAARRVDRRPCDHDPRPPCRPAGGARTDGLHADDARRR